MSSALTSNTESKQAISMMMMRVQVRHAEKISPVTGTRYLAPTRSNEQRSFAVEHYRQLRRFIPAFSRLAPGIKTGAASEGFFIAWNRERATLTIGTTARHIQHPDNPDKTMYVLNNIEYTIEINTNNPSNEFIGLLNSFLAGLYKFLVKNMGDEYELKYLADPYSLPEETFENWGAWVMRGIANSLKEEQNRNKTRKLPATALDIQFNESASN